MYVFIDFGMFPVYSFHSRVGLVRLGHPFQELLLSNLSRAVSLGQNMGYSAIPRYSWSKSPQYTFKVTSNHIKMDTKKTTTQVPVRAGNPDVFVLNGWRVTSFEP